MEKVFMLVVLLVVCSVCMAGDPNSMENATAQKPVTHCIKENADGTGVVTIKMYFDKIGIEAIKLIEEEASNKGNFTALVTKWRQDVATKAAKIWLFYITKLHEGDSLTYLKNMAAVKEAAAKEKDPE